MFKLADSLLNPGTHSCHYVACHPVTAVVTDILNCIFSVFLFLISSVLWGLLLCTHPLRWLHKRKSHEVRSGILRATAPAKSTTLQKILTVMPSLFSRCGMNVSHQPPAKQ